MHSTSAVQIPNAAQTLLGQFTAIHQVQTLDPVGAGFNKAIESATERYPIVQRFVLTGAGELGKFKKAEVVAAGKMVNNLKLGACIANRMGGRPETEEGANWVTKAVVEDPKGAEKEITDTFDACYMVQENVDVLPALVTHGEVWACSQMAEAAFDAQFVLGMAFEPSDIAVACLQPCISLPRF